LASTWNGQTVNVAIDGIGVRATFRITPTGLDFGPVPLNTNGPTQTAVVTNLSAQSVKLSLKSSYQPDPFTVSEDCDGTTLAFGETCSLRFDFRPTSAGT